MKNLASLIIMALVVLCFSLGLSQNVLAETPDSDTYVFRMDEHISDYNQQKEVLLKQLNRLIGDEKYSEALDLISTFKYTDEQILQYENEIKERLRREKYFAFGGNIDVLVFEPIISFPSILKNNSSLSDIVDDNQITISEFEKILHYLYENNYVLINPLSPKKLLLPVGKKPIVLMLEDVNYDTKKGTVDRIILSEDNKIITYTSKRGISDRIAYDNDFITLSNNFVSNHPSFSLDGARGLICVDGSTGIFGYKTYKSNANSKHQKKKCLRLANTLKDNGWNFVSKGYKYGIDKGDVDFASGLAHWREVVEPILGKTHAYFGAFKDVSVYKEDLLSSYEYTTLFDANNSLNSPYKCHKISGKTLRSNSHKLSRFFDTEKVYDHINRVTTYCFG